MPVRLRDAKSAKLLILVRLVTSFINLPQIKSVKDITVLTTAYSALKQIPALSVTSTTMSPPITHVPPQLKNPDFVIASTTASSVEIKIKQALNLFVALAF